VSDKVAITTHRQHPDNHHDQHMLPILPPPTKAAQPSPGICICALYLHMNKVELKEEHPKNGRRLTVMSCGVANLSKKNGLPNSSRSVRHEIVHLRVILELFDKLFTTFRGFD
jgi:hypothetical protein